MPLTRINELRRRRKRQEKIRSLKSKLAKAKNDDEKNRILAKLERVSPFITKSKKED